MPFPFCMAPRNTAKIIANSCNCLKLFLRFLQNIWKKNSQLYFCFFSFILNLSICLSIYCFGFFQGNENICGFAVYIYIYTLSRVFANGPVDRSSIPDRLIPKTQKWYLIPPCLTHHYKVRIKGKWCIPQQGVGPSPTSWCSSYWKGEPSTTVDQLTIIRILEFSEAHTFEKASLIGFELRRKQGMIRNLSR